MHHLRWNWIALRIRQGPNKQTVRLRASVRPLQHNNEKLWNTLSTKRSHLDGILVLHPTQVAPMQAETVLLLVW